VANAIRGLGGAVSGQWVLDEELAGGNGCRPAACAEKISVAIKFDLLSENRWFAWLNWLVAGAIAVDLAFFHGRWLTPDVYTMALRCGLAP
jgi:hypothetical protein